MKEQLYTIPVNDAFNEDCECPLCHLYSKLEQDALDFTLGPSYMEEDIREQTNKEGFCNNHILKLYKKQNSLGLANILKTHLFNRIGDIEKLATKSLSRNILFKKNTLSPISEYIIAHNNSCFICNKIDATFNRYIATILYLYKKDTIDETSFKKKFNSSKGFCIKHYEMLYQAALNTLNGSHLGEFVHDLNTITIENLKRVDADLDWYIDKFDYRYKDEPWKNSKDAIERTILKTNGISVD
ncbi:MAG: hypothetical protein E7262_10270 [Lachnospiraceae bacterium]|nr:hypothetical protein [Lachnospiraceae bacterium]